MENASRAIIMAGGILMGVIIVSVLVMVFQPIGGVYEEEGLALSIEQLEEYNRQFNTYDRSMYGSELLSLANLVHDYDNRLLIDQEPTGEYYRNNKIIVTVKLHEDTIGDDTVIPSYESIKRESRSKADGCDIERLRQYDMALEKKMNDMVKAGVSKRDDTYQDVKSSVTQLRSTPFKCISAKTKYNKEGRISRMVFEQVKE
ncbi:MAG: hypothetical protein HFJ29_05635 [Clostridia bacterium]|nr:hypothetical protein [Clostridia bacterium]